MRFYGTLIGPEGGQTYKSAAKSLETDVRHDGVKVRIETRCSLVAGAPHVRITACGEGSQVVFYDGPMARAADSVSPRRYNDLDKVDIERSDPYRMTDQFCGCGRPLREFEVALGGCTVCAGQAPAPAACEDCGGKGWEIFNEGAPGKALGEVQSCDLCETLAGDSEAFDAARAAGLGVDAEGLVTRLPEQMLKDATCAD
jgi:hypothetical protein